MLIGNCDVVRLGFEVIVISRFDKHYSDNLRICASCNYVKYTLCLSMLDLVCKGFVFDQLIEE